MQKKLRKNFLSLFSVCVNNFNVRKSSFQLSVINQHFFFQVLEELMKFFHGTTHSKFKVVGDLLIRTVEQKSKPDKP